MIYIVLGTRAQLVKMAPIIRLMVEKELPIRLVHTGQHKESIAEICKDFKIWTSWYYLYNKDEEISTIYGAFQWVLFLLGRLIFKPNLLLPDFDGASDNIVLVHGDTLSTVIGAFLGRRLGIPVGHVESGLRSFNLLNPFPEEINRLITFALADICFCPGRWAISNLDEYRVKKINTLNNTLLDSVRIALESGVSLDFKLPSYRYAVVSIHRFENIFFKRNFEEIIDQLVWVAKGIHLVFVLHPATYKRLVKLGYISRLENNGNITLLDRMGYFDFIGLLSGSDFVITDGGSNQEELSYLKIPTFLMRKNTERQEGLHENVFLGHLSNESLKSFLSTIGKKGKPDLAMLKDSDSPSEIICKEVAFAVRR